MSTQYAITPFKPDTGKASANFPEMIALDTLIEEVARRYPDEDVQVGPPYNPETIPDVPGVVFVIPITDIHFRYFWDAPMLYIDYYSITSEFVIWFRGIIDEKFPLYLFETGDTGVFLELTSATTVEEVEQFIY